MKNKIRMIGMDLDGTLLKTNKELTAYTKDVLKRAAEQGIIVMPATGRPFSGIPKELIRLQEIRYAVTANGARVIDMKKNKVIVEELLAYDIAEATLTDLNAMIRSGKFTIMALDMHPKRHWPELISI